MKTYIFLLAIAFFTPHLNEDTNNAEASIQKNPFGKISAEDVLFSCSYMSTITDDDCIPDNIGSFTPDNLSAAVILKKIMGCLNADSSQKISANFLTYECTFPEPVFKALTKKSDSTRYILYTKKQLEQLMNINTDWVAYSIFAHEIGHHLYGHSLSNPKSLEESRRRELQADFLSGFVLHKLNSTLIQAQSGINSFDQHPSEELEEFCSHPTKARRLSAVSMGFDFENAPQANTFQLLNTDSLAKRNGLEQIFNKSLQLFIEKDFNRALATLETLAPILSKKNKVFAHFFNNTGFIKKEMGRTSEAIKDFDKAITLDSQSPEFFLNRGVIKQKSSKKELKAEGLEDIKIGNELMKAQVDLR